MVTIIAKCTCSHESQDKLHGKGRRVHNSMGSRDFFYRCTVCGNEKEVCKKTQAPSSS